MRPRRLFTLVLTLSLGVALIAGCSSSSSSKSSKKSGGGGTTVSSQPAGTPVAVTVGDTSGTNKTLTATPASVPAGPVTFTVKNTGTLDHEMIVLKTDSPFDQLPVVDAGDPPARVTSGANKVDEANKVGETGDPNLKPGGTRTFTIKNMAPGNYVLACNLAKHYTQGMRAAFTVR